MKYEIEVICDGKLVVHAAVTATTRMAALVHMLALSTPEPGTLKWLLMDNSLSLTTTTGEVYKAIIKPTHHTDLAILILTNAISVEIAENRVVPRFHFDLSDLPTEILELVDKGKAHFEVYPIFESQLFVLSVEGYCLYSSNTYTDCASKLIEVVNY